MKLGYEAECILRFNKLTGYRAGDLIKPKWLEIKSWTPLEYQEMIFKKFSQTPKSYRTSFDGE
jgi:hypothetical protein